MLTGLGARRLGGSLTKAGQRALWVVALFSLFVLLAAPKPALAATSVTVTCVPSAVTVGQTITCDAQGTPPFASGTHVLFSTKTGSVGSIEPTSCLVNSTGECTTPIPTPTTTGAGTLVVLATYSGDGSTGSSSQIVVEKATPALSVSCIPSTVTVGSPTTCTAQVSNGYNVDGATITFSGAQSAVKIAFPGGNTCQLSSDACGVAVSGVSAGTGTVQAIYSGDGNNTAPSPATQSISISKAISTATVVCSPVSVIAGEQATCTATVKGYTPTGTIVWSSSDAAGVFSSNPCTLSSGSCGVAYTASSSATITASYQGDGNNTVSQGSFSISSIVQESIQVTVANSGTVTDLTLSGCNVSQTTIPTDGKPYAFTASSGCNGIVATLPPAGATTRYLTAGGKSSLPIPSCAASSCQLFSATIYYQLMTTYQIAPASPSSWSTAGTITVTGTALGVQGQSICTIAVTTGAGQFSCQGWTDYNTQTTMGALQVSQNQRWATGQSSFTDTSGGNVHTSSYYSQVLEDFQYSLVGSTTAPATPLLSYTGFGTNSTFPLTGSQSLVWLDSGSSWSVPAALTGSSSVERWESSITSGAATAGQTVSLAYYHQFLVTFGYSVIGNGTAYIAPVVQFTSFGAPLQGSQGWVDAGTSYSFTNPLSGSTSTERWFTPTPSALASASGPASAVYYHQFAFVLNFTVSGGGTYDNPRLNFTALGSPGIAQVNATSTTVWIDAGAKWGLSTLLPNSSPTQRWVTKQTTSGVASAPVLGGFLYYHQYLGTLQYSISGAGGNPPVPTMNYTSFTASILAPMSTTGATYWMDSGSTWTVPPTLPGIQGERWLSNLTSSVATNFFVEDVQYMHQFYVEVGVSTPAGGQVANTNQWEDQGGSVILNATAAQTWSFAYWQGVTAFSYNGTTRLPTLSVLGPANETAIFFPGLTITTSGQGSVQYVYGKINGSVPADSTDTIYPPPGRNVTLTAVPVTVSIMFDGWTGEPVGVQMPSASAKSLQAPIAIESPAVVHATFSTDYTDIRTFALASLGIFAAACFVFIVRRGHIPKLNH